MTVVKHGGSLPYWRVETPLPIDYKFPKKEQVQRKYRAKRTKKGLGPAVALCFSDGQHLMTSAQRKDTKKKKDIPA